MTKKTIINVLLIAAVISFFVTPVGYYGKVYLNRIFAKTPSIILSGEREQIANYDWKLKNAEWQFFNFNKSKGKVVFINFWASWRLPCAAELQEIQEVYSTYGNAVDFYIITDEEREPVELFMKKNKFTFPVTYLIIGGDSPLDVLEPPASYVLNKKGEIVIKETDIADWDNATISALLEELIKE
ncbi:TlpA disulfide reductase family protein [uncultured Maribacter sp.]|uniref:TlpA family protein disulfide reductase n=1 Tax=uncultured Maribacter sp. TaxID=431308 RepID=UPI0026316FDD|nr:TlpA disulfide reductase family protein [uncultured Maribacter sp.]